MKHAEQVPAKLAMHRELPVVTTPNHMLKGGTRPCYAKGLVSAALRCQVYASSCAGANLMPQQAKISHAGRACFPSYHNAGGGACSVDAQDMTWLAEWVVHVCQRVSGAPTMQLALCYGPVC